MKYLCLVYMEDPAAIADSECIACGVALRENGKMIGGEA